MKKVTFCKLETSLSRNFVYNLQTFRRFFQVYFYDFVRIQHKNNFYLPLNNDKQKFVTFLKFFCRLHNLLLKFRECPVIFRVTGANQNARKLLFTDLVNIKIVYFVFFLLTLKTHLYSLSYSGSGSCCYSLSFSEFRMSCFLVFQTSTLNCPQ